LHNIHHPTHFCHLFPFSMVPTPPGRGGSALLFSDFARERKKKWHFCLFKIAIKGVSLWHFHVYLSYSPNWVISSNFLPSQKTVFQPHLQFFFLIYIWEFVTQWMCQGKVNGKNNIKEFVMFPFQKR
jgi:hypothetical protein